MIESIALALLALMVQSEAATEPFDGKVAVAYVAMNRVQMSGRTLQDVLTQPRQFKINTRATVTESSYLAARTAYSRLQPDPTNGADHFYAHAVRPWPAWYDERYMTVRIDSHTFLKLGGF